MLDYRLHYAILATEERLQAAARDRSARRVIPTRVVRLATSRRDDRAARR
jgi:hypothetical protein